MGNMQIKATVNKPERVENGFFVVVDGFLSLMIVFSGDLHK